MFVVSQGGSQGGAFGSQKVEISDLITHKLSSPQEPPPVRPILSHGAETLHHDASRVSTGFCKAPSRGDVDVRQASQVYARFSTAFFYTRDVVGRRRIRHCCGDAQWRQHRKANIASSIFIGSVQAANGDNALW
jgi:hypothetical protein